ncbi:MAG: DUF4167 domain-containing protein [Hyphomonadaceae bacterium]
MKRQRGRGRKPGGGHHNNQNPHRSMESSGPEGGKVRGPAALIYERYQQLARDAASSGDRVLSENYLQHADHYLRLIRSMQPAQPAPQQGDRFANGGNLHAEDEDDGGDGEMAADGNDAGEGDQPDVEFPQGQQPQGEREGGNRRRGRRSRYRADGDREGGEASAEGAPPPRQERERRPSREEREQPDTAEGFAVGPKPAFMRGD